MSIVAITGNHPRHAYLVNALNEAGILSGWIKQERAAFVPQSPKGLSSHLTQLFDLHFARREQAEARFFGDSVFLDDGLIYTVTKETLNDAGTVAFIKKINPTIVLSYGCHKISEEVMAATSATFWNTHGGLSPWYRGVTTHFWPSYLLEPQTTGMTLHETTDKIDGGGILHQTSASLVKGDGLHDLAARTVKQYADELPTLLAKSLKTNDVPKGILQKTTGKIWISDDWRPEHLPLIYDTYGDRIVDRVLDGTLVGRKPKTISALM